MSPVGSLLISFAHSCRAATHCFCLGFPCSPGTVYFSLWQLPPNTTSGAVLLGRAGGRAAPWEAHGWAPPGAGQSHCATSAGCSIPTCAEYHSPKPSSHNRPSPVLLPRDCPARSDMAMQTSCGGQQGGGSGGGTGSDLLHRCLFIKREGHRSEHLPGSHHLRCLSAKALLI